MGVRAALRRWLLDEPKNADRPNEIRTSEDLDRWIRFGGSGSASGVDVTVDNASGLPAVAASVRILSEAIAHLPCVLYRRDGENRMPARENSMFRLIHDRPNRWQTSYQWRKLLMRDLLYRGRHYSLKVGSPTVTQSLIRLHPDRTKAKQNPSTMEVTFEYQRESGEVLTLPRDRVLHVWCDSDDGIDGISPIKAYRESIGDGLAIRQHGSRFFSNAARVSGVLEMPEGARIGDDSVKALLDDFNSMYQGNNNAHKTAALPGGITFRPVSVNMDDAQWIEARKTTAREIYGIFGIPPHKAGDLADATFSNVEHENLGFVIDSVTPRVVALEQAFNRDLLDNDPGLYFKFNLSALMRGDFKSRQEGLQIQRRSGVISANEWRSLEDLNPREDAGGDRYIVEKNMADDTGPLGDASNEQNSTSGGA